MLEHGLTIPDDDVYLGPVVDMGGMDKKTSPLFSAAALFFLSLEKGSILANAEIKKTYVFHPCVIVQKKY